MAEIGQRHGDKWYKVIDVGPFEARYQIATIRPDGMGWEVTSERIYKGETAAMDAERDMTADLIAVIHGGG